MPLIPESPCGGLAIMHAVAGQARSIMNGQFANLDANCHESGKEQLLRTAQTAWHLKASRASIGCFVLKIIVPLHKSHECMHLKITGKAVLWMPSQTEVRLASTSLSCGELVARPLHITGHPYFLLLDAYKD